MAKKEMNPIKIKTTDGERKLLAKKKKKKKSTYEAHINRWNTSHAILRRPFVATLRDCTEKYIHN